MVPEHRREDGILPNSFSQASRTLIPSPTNRAQKKSQTNLPININNILTQ